MLILSGQDVDECLPIGAAVAGMRPRLRVVLFAFRHMMDTANAADSD